MLDSSVSIAQFVADSSVCSASSVVKKSAVPGESAAVARVTTRSHPYCVLGSYVVLYWHEAERVRPTGRRHLQNRLSVVAGWPVGRLPTANWHFIVCEPQSAATGAALYGRVSSAEQKADVTRQLPRLRGGAGY
jgi:hypothetical protein